MKKVIDITPDPSLFSKIGKQNYTVATALAELVDNSIDEALPHKKLHIDINIDLKKGSISIADDGPGMDEKTARNSLRLGHSEKDGKLGAFGIGLKGSTMYLGKKFQIHSTQEGSDVEFLLSFDEDDWLKKGSWKCEMTFKDGVPVESSGTRVIITDLKVKLHDKMPSRVRTNLAMRFAPFIEGEIVSIAVNGVECKPDKPELVTSDEFPEGRLPIDIVVRSGYPVRGWVGILEKGGANTGEYGFRTFHRNRLIDPYAKVGFAEHPQHRKIVGELHLDHVPVTNNKSSFIKEDERWQELNDREGPFWQFMVPVTKKARQMAEKRVVSETTIKDLEKKKDELIACLKIDSSFYGLNLPDRVVLKILNLGVNGPLSRSDHSSKQTSLEVTINSEFPGFREQKDKVSFGLIRICSEIVRICGGNNFSYEEGDLLVSRMISSYFSWVQKEKERRAIEERIASDQKRLKEMSRN